MKERFNRDSARNALFSSYDAQQTRSRPASAASSPAARSRSQQNAPYSTYHSNNSSPYSFGAQNEGSHLIAQPPAGAGFSAYPGTVEAVGRRSGDGGFRPATPNRKGQYSDAVMDELESQNDEQVSEMSKRIKMLKEVCAPSLVCAGRSSGILTEVIQVTIQIGDEIRDSTALAEQMNEGFESTRNRLRGTMNRMLRMAERTGVGWRIWLGFFVFVFLLFGYVWLF
jgi:blocked early in transport 1